MSNEIMLSATSVDEDSHNNIDAKKATAVPHEKNKSEGQSRYKKGDSLTFVQVRFPGNAKAFPFLIGKRIFAYGKKVMAMSDRGMTVGHINSFPYEKSFIESMLPLKSIAREASQEDINEQLSNFKQERKAEVLCQNLIEKYKLDMILTHIEIIQFGKKAVFYFNAPSRIDFRELVKELVKDLKMRIELRQISVRDRAAALGGIGDCGRQTCCSTFLKSYGNISIKMAKNQNLALIPSKINGVCGQLKCCIKFEDKVYTAKRKIMPKLGAIIKLLTGEIGKVERLHVLKEQIEVLNDKGVKKKYSGYFYDANMQEMPEGYIFPKSFTHISNETSTLIVDKGLEEKSFIDDESEIVTPAEPNNIQTDDAAILKDDSNEKDESKSLEASAEKKVSRPNNRNRNRNRNNKNKMENTESKKEPAIATKPKKVYSQKKKFTPENDDSQKNDTSNEN